MRVHSASDTGMTDKREMRTSAPRTLYEPERCS
jgi:hypothetical protein